MTRKRVPLGNFITEYSVRNRNNEDIPVYSVTNSQGFCREYFGKEVASKDKTTYKIVPYGYFAYNPSRINVGSVDWQRREARVIVSPLYNVFSLSDELDRQFLYYFLKSNIGRQMIQAKAAGSVRDNLKLDMLKEMTIPDSSLDDQRHCAAILDKLQYLIELRKTQLKELSKLVNARFVELFGGKDYPSIPLIDTVKEGAGLSYGIVVPGENVENGIPMVRPSDFKNGKLDLLNVYRVAADIEEKYAKTRLIGDEILVQVIGQPGQVMLATNECKGMNVTRNLAVIRPNHEIINRIYLKEFIEKEDSQQILLKNTKQSTLKQLPLNLLKQLEVQVPPMELQNEFADFVEQIDKSKASNPTESGSTGDVTILFVVNQLRKKSR